MQTSSCRALRVIVIVALLSVSWGCRPNEIRPVTSVAERVKSSGRIKAGYAVVDPAVIKNPNTGELSGIFVDTLKQMGKRLSVEVQFTEEVGWDAMIAGLTSDRYDIVCAQVWPDGKRAREASFTSPLYFIGVGAYVRFNDHRFDSDLSKINSKDVRIAMIDGSTADVIAEQDFPKATKVAIPGLSDATQTYLDITSNKADVTFTYTSYAEKYIRNNPRSIRNTVPDRPLRVFANTFMIKPGEFHFASMLNTAIEELHGSGEIEKTIRKYETVPGELMRVALPYRPFAPAR